MNDSAALHDHDAVRDFFHDGEIVRDKKNGQSVLFPHFQKQSENLFLAGNIERGYDFIGDQKLRVGDEGACDGDALQLPAGKFARFFEKTVRVDAAVLTDFSDHSLPFCPVKAAIPQAERFCKGTADFHTGIEACKRVLKDHLHLLSVGAKFSGWQRAKISIVKPDASVIRTFRPHENPGKCGLAATGFAEQAKDFPPAYFK